MEIAKTKCCANKKSKRINAGDGASFLTTALLILAPKCPFCVMAYTGSILMFFDIESSAIMPYVQHIKPALGALVLLIIVLNYRGRKTIISLSIGITAMVFLLLSNYSLYPLLPEWLLYSAFFFAAWYNGNFEFFYRFLRFSKKAQKVKQ